MPLPPRMWYNLPQAAEKLSRDFNESVTVEDLLHFAVTGRLELCLFVGRENKKLSIYGVDNKNIKELKYRLLRNDIFIKTEFLHANLYINTPNNKTYRDDDKRNIIDKNKDLFFINGFLALEFYIMPFLSISNINFQSITDDKVCLKNAVFVIPRSVLKNRKMDFRLYPHYYDESNDSTALIIDIDKIFILEKELELFIKGKIANEYLQLNAWGFNIPKDSNNEQKIIEKTTIDPKKNADNIILNSIIATLEKNPKAGLYSVVNAVGSFIKTERRDLRNFLQSEKTYINKLKELGIERPRQSGKKTEKIKVIIKI